MRSDGSVGRKLRGMASEPVTPLRGVALLVCTAVAATALLGALARPQAVPAVAGGGAGGGAPLVLDAPVVVHVAGLVARPGVYRLPGGSRVTDAIDAAGGAAAGADLSGLNLARVVEDGEQVLVMAPGSADATASGTRPDGKLDLNRASAVELDALPGIGPVLAGRIVAYRDQHGRFGAVRDLRRVQGIGEKLYRSLAELVAV